MPRWPGPGRFASGFPGGSHGAHCRAGGKGADTADAAKYGADKVFTPTGGDFGVYNSEIYGTALASFCKSSGCDILLIGSTAMGKDLAPRAAARLDAGCVSDAVGLSWDGGLVVRRPVFAGKCFADVTCNGGAAVVGIRPNAFAADEHGGAVAGDVVVDVQADLR